MCIVAKSASLASSDAQAMGQRLGRLHQYDISFQETVCVTSSHLVSSDTGGRRDHSAIKSRKSCNLLQNHKSTTKPPNRSHKPLNRAIYIPRCDIREILRSKSIEYTPIELLVSIYALLHYKVGVSTERKLLKFEVASRTLGTRHLSL